MPPTKNKPQHKPRKRPAPKVAIGRTRRTSDIPLDLRKEREAFVRTFLRKGVELTESLLEENRQLTGELGRMREDNARLRKQVASDDAIRDLIRTIDGLEREKLELLNRSTELEQVSRRHEGRHAEIEQELNDLANLYVASVQLHAALTPRRVVRHVKELLAQLIGAESFVIYVIDPGEKRARPVGSEGVPAAALGPIDLGSGLVGEVMTTGLTWVSQEAPLRRGSVEQPIAVIPLRIEDKPVGAIAIVSLLTQKRGWVPVDHELFKLLGDQAGVALAGANLFSKARGPLDALAGLAETL